jgi:hypothetical protein
VTVNRVVTLPMQICLDSLAVIGILAAVDLAIAAISGLGRAVLSISCEGRDFAPHGEQCC